tara:strand:- start:394 stop:2382 length:1989 start_codon:yes stop_codon:yes gene_type:complete
MRMLATTEGDLREIKELKSFLRESLHDLKREFKNDASFLLNKINNLDYKTVVENNTEKNNILLKREIDYELESFYEEKVMALSPRIENNKQVLEEYGIKFNILKEQFANEIADLVRADQANENKITEAYNNLTTNLEESFIAASNKVQEVQNHLNESLKIIDEAHTEISNKVENLKDEMTSSSSVLTDKIVTIKDQLSNSIKLLDEKLVKRIDDQTYSKEKEDIFLKSIEKSKELTKKVDKDKGILEQKLEEAEKLIEDKYQQSKKDLKEYKELLEKKDSMLEKSIKNSSNRYSKLLNKKSKSFYSSIDLVKEELTQKAKQANNKINEYFNSKIDKIETEYTALNDTTKKNIIKLIEDKKKVLREDIQREIRSLKDIINNDVRTEVRQLKDFITINIPEQPEEEEEEFNPEKFKSQFESTINQRFSDELRNLRKHIENYGGGGGSVAVQSKDGDLSVKSLEASQTILSAGRDLADIFAKSADAGITQVDAGAGLTGGGTSSTVTLNAVAGDGITVNANDIQVNNTVARTNSANSFSSALSANSNLVLTDQFEQRSTSTISRKKIYNGTVGSSETTINTFAKSGFKSAKLVVTLSKGTKRTTFEMLVSYNDSSVFSTTYAILDSQAVSLLNAVDVSGSGSTIDIDITGSETGIACIIEGTSFY